MTVIISEKGIIIIATWFLMSILHIELGYYYFHIPKTIILHYSEQK